MLEDIKNKQLAIYRSLKDIRFFKIGFFILSFLTLTFASFSTTKNEKKSAISESYALIERVLPGSKTNFEIQIISDTLGLDVFEVSTSKNKIVLKGNNPISIAEAFNWYLKHVALISFDWEANAPLQFNGSLPLPEKATRNVCQAKERFFNNTCTFGYTFPYWKWNKWERFIDWMAMNGVNRPLMQAGQEAAWLRVWQSFGLSQKQVLAYFSAPAHLPWHRMANLDSWGGPLPMNYVKGQAHLQQKILQRSRALGMKPVLSAFAGHIPRELLTKFPKAKITAIAPGWGGMEAKYSTFFLDPSDSLFAVIQKRFLLEQEKLYGTDHLYSADPFNEITPPSWEEDYLAQVSKTIYNTMAAADKDAIWYQMSWTFYYDPTHWTQPRLSAMIHAVPKGKLVFLDYVAEEQEYFRKSNNFQGAPFIWCYLGNFGGNTNLVAPLNKVVNRIKSVDFKNACTGVGSTLEGINQNPIIYEAVLEMPWRLNENLSADDLVVEYANRRAQTTDAATQDAWKKLRANVLVDSAVAIWNHSIVYQVLPVMDLKKSFWTTDPKIPYDNKKLLEAIVSLTEAGEKAKSSDTWKLDLVNLTRQLLGNYGTELYTKMMADYNRNDLKSFQKSSEKFIKLGFELDELLGTRHEFLLGAWLADARAWGKSNSEKAYYQRDAREIVTTWHNNSGGLTDYSNRQWNGLISSYYLPRWIEFIRRLEISLQNKKLFDEKEFTTWCVSFEKKWVDNSNQKFSENPVGDSVLKSFELIDKYKNEIELN